MKTLEFKLDLTESQQQTIDSWLSRLKVVWNYGLSLYEEKQQRDYRKKLKTEVPVGLVLKWRKKKIIGSGIYTNRRGIKSCPIRQHTEIEDIKKAINRAYRVHEQPWITEICSRARVTMIRGNLNNAWRAYQKGIRRRPRYKGKKDRIHSFSNNSSANDCQIKGDRFKLPNIGWVKVMGFSKRWDTNLEIRQYSVVKKASGYYFQVVGDLPPTNYGKMSDKMIGIDIGSTKVWTDNIGRQIEPKRYYKTQQARLKRLQKKASRQQSRSKNQEKTYKKVARLHEQIAARRKYRNHKLSTQLIQEYGGIALEDINLANLTRSPNAKIAESGNGYRQNGRKRKAGLNKSLLDHGIGQLRDMIEAKAATSGREVIKVPAAYTSQRCHVCGHRSPENRPKKPMTAFKCVNCGHSDHADRNAAINILKDAILESVREYRTYPTLEGEVKPDAGATQQPIGNAPIGDAENKISRQIKQEVSCKDTPSQVCSAKPNLWKQELPYGSKSLADRGL